MRVHSTFGKVVIATGLQLAVFVSVAALAGHGSADAATSLPSCRAELSAIASVSELAGIGLASPSVPPVQAGTSPAQWSRILREGGDVASAWAAVHIHSAATGRRFIADLEHDASTATDHQDCRS